MNAGSTGDPAADIGPRRPMARPAMPRLPTSLARVARLASLAATPQASPAAHSSIGVAASTSPAAATASAMPGQAGTVPPDTGEVTRSQLTMAAAISPDRATLQPASTKVRRRRTSSAQNADPTRPAVIQTGGSPGPPGLSSSSGPGSKRATASPGWVTPASSRNADGLVTKWKVHGIKTMAGTTATIVALI